MYVRSERSKRVSKFPNKLFYRFGSVGVNAASAGTILVQHVVTGHSTKADNKAWLLPRPSLMFNISIAVGAE